MKIIEINSEIKSEITENNIDIKNDEKLDNIIVDNSEIKDNQKIKEIDNKITVKSNAIETLENTEIVSKSYLEIAREIIAAEGLGGLFGRGLQVTEFLIF